MTAMYSSGDAARAVGRAVSVRSARGRNGAEVEIALARPTRRPDQCPPVAPRRHRRRRGHRRCGLQRIVERSRAAPSRSGAASDRDRTRDGRLRRVGPQRRLVRRGTRRRPRRRGRDVGSRGGHLDDEGDHRHRRRDRTSRRCRGNRVRIRTRRRTPSRPHRAPAATPARRDRRVPPSRIRRRRAPLVERRRGDRSTVGHVGARRTPLCARCTGAASTTRPWACRGRRAARRHDRRAHGRARHPAGLAGSSTIGGHRPRRGACRRGRSCHRGLHPRPARPASRPRPALLAHGGHRAARRCGLGVDRSASVRDVRRRSPHGDLRPAHDRRSDRLRRARRAVPVRLGHRSGDGVGVRRP